MKKVVTLFLLVIFFTLGFFVHQHFVGCDKLGLKYLNKELLCADKPVVEKYGYIGLKNDLLNYIQTKKDVGEVTEISVFFSDLQYGPTLGIEEYDKFSPASLLKLPLLLTYLRLAQDNPELLNNQIIAPAYEEIFFQSIEPKESITTGENYSVQQLLKYMIKYSDNRSYYLLLDYLDKLYPGRTPLVSTFYDLGIVDPQYATEDTISVKSYASIFVQLYNATFFDTKEPSEEVLSMLLDTDFDEGIEAGVPSEIKVAEKFGERFGFDQDLAQLHNCGIVYYPDNPYLLCVMTRGADINKLSAIISDISRMVYEEFDSRRLE